MSDCMSPRDPCIHMPLYSAALLICECQHRCMNPGRRTSLQLGSRQGMLGCCTAAPILGYPMYTYAPICLHCCSNLSIKQAKSLSVRPSVRHFIRASVHPLVSSSVGASVRRCAGAPVCRCVGVSLSILPSFLTPIHPCFLLSLLFIHLSVRHDLTRPNLT